MDFYLDQESSRGIATFGDVHTCGFSDISSTYDLNEDKHIVENLYSNSLNSTTPEIASMISGIHQQLGQLTQALKPLHCTGNHKRKVDTEHSDDADDEMIKLLTRKERNKQSAQQSRERQKRKVSELESHVSYLQETNQVLQQHLETQAHENVIMRQQLGILLRSQELSQVPFNPHTHLFTPGASPVETGSSFNSHMGLTPNMVPQFHHPTNTADTTDTLSHHEISRFQPFANMCNISQPHYKPADLAHPSPLNLFRSAPYILSAPIIFTLVLVLAICGDFCCVDQENSDYTFLGVDSSIVKPGRRLLQDSGGEPRAFMRSVITFYWNETRESTINETSMFESSNQTNEASNYRPYSFSKSPSFH